MWLHLLNDLTESVLGKGSLIIVSAMGPGYEVQTLWRLSVL
jgi:hypothetical protein